MKATRRFYSEEFKAEAVRMVREDLRRPAAVAKELGITRMRLADWLKREKKREAEAGSGVPLNQEERQELMRLRRENNRLKETQEILKKATAFFAKQSR